MLFNISEFHENQCKKNHTFLMGVNEICYMGSEHNAVQHLWVSWKLKKHKWNYSHTSPMKVYNILTVKKALAMSVHYIIQYTIRNLAINAQFH